MPFWKSRKAGMAPKPTGGEKIGTRTLQKRSPGAVLEKHEKSMTFLSENERFLMVENHCMCETVGSKRAFASFGTNRKINGKRTPKINEIWSKMEPGAPKGRLCQGPGPISARSEKGCFFARRKSDQKSRKIGPKLATRVDFVAPGPTAAGAFLARRSQGPPRARPLAEN